MHIDSWAHLGQKIYWFEINICKISHRFMSSTWYKISIGLRLANVNLQLGSRPASVKPSKDKQLKVPSQLGG